MMSETYETPPGEGEGGPLSRPNSDGLPPKTGGDIGADTGGMLGEG
jgi:hypothetical protein